MEQSHGAARPTLPRSSDLAPVRAVRDPAEGRGPGGRFAAGNRLAAGRGWKSTLRQLVRQGAGEATPELALLTRQAEGIYHSTLRELPHDGPMVRALVVQLARETGRAGHFTS